MSDDRARRETIARAGFQTVEVAHLDVDDIDDLALGRDVDDAVEAGEPIDDVARRLGYTEAVASDLRRRYRALRDEFAARDQIALF
jgi:hypothetical protein